MFVHYGISAKIPRTCFLIGVSSLPKEQLADLADTSLFGLSHFFERLLQLRINPDS